MKPDQYSINSQYEQVAQAEANDGALTCNEELSSENSRLYNKVSRSLQALTAFNGRFFSVVFPWFLAITFMSLSVFQNLHKTSSNPIFSQPLYSPAQDIIKYEAKAFMSGLEGNKDKKYYGEPSPEVDAAWEALYSFGPIKLDRWEAIRLPNRTWPIVQEPGKYIALLDVFHQLHCLDAVRKALRPDYYGDLDWTEFGFPHVGHCIDSIRESIMCMSDISVNVWQWDLVHNLSHSLGNSLHTCRNFDDIRSWAYDRRLANDFDKYTYVGDDPLAGAFDLRTNTFDLASPLS